MKQEMNFWKNLEKMMLSNLYVKDVMISFPEVNAVYEDDFFHDALEILNKNRWGAVVVVDKDKKLKGIITDGDIRRIFVKNQEPIAQLNSEPISKFMNSNPFKVKMEFPLMDLIKVMNEKSFLNAPVVDNEDRFLGLVHIQHIVKKIII